LSEKNNELLDTIFQSPAKSNEIIITFFQGPVTRSEIIVTFFRVTNNEVLVALKGTLFEKSRNTVLLLTGPFEFAASNINELKRTVNTLLTAS
jgi:hypothetical protein